MDSTAHFPEAVAAVKLIRRCFPPTRFLCNQIGESTNVYSVEVSMFGFVTDDQTNPIRPYTEEDCKGQLRSL